MTNILVAVYSTERPGRKPLVTAYTLWFSPLWPGYCPHLVEARNGTEAKKKAIAEHRANCLASKREKP